MSMQKLVYMGARFFVPNGAEWMAIDADGDVCAYTNPPEIMGGGGYHEFWGGS